MPVPTKFVRVFLDSEFSSPIDMELISIGLISERGEEFYAEVNPVPYEKCNDFVRDFVLPQLDRTSEVTMSAHELTASLAAWLDRVRSDDDLVVVSYDFVGDLILMKEALGGKLPAFARGVNIRDRLNEDARTRFFVESGKRHHALVDARAMRHAYHAKYLPF